MITTQALCLSAILLGASSDVGTNPNNVLLDFSATWCGPCQQMSPLVSRLQRQGYPIRKVDVDQNRQLASRYGISSIPAFVLIINGKVTQRIVGPTSERQLKTMMARIPKRKPAKTPASSLLASKGNGSSRAGDSRKRKLSIPFFGRKRKNESQPPATPTDATVIRANIDNTANTERTRPLKGSPKSATVRLRIKDGTGENFGTGTIIESRPGKSIVLTCAHIFRGVNSDTKIAVDLFRDGKPETYVGKVLDYDEKSDVGLMVFATDTSLPVAKLAAHALSLARGDKLYSMGCDGGEMPTKMPMQVTALNRYRGPDNVECSGEPVRGRPGGGLFNLQGKLVGVCSAADPREHLGLYAGHAAVVALLNKASLGHLHDGTLAKSNNELLRSKTPKNLREGLANGDRAIGNPKANRFLPANSSRTNELAGVKDAEVVCIIRPQDNSQASRVVIINRASSSFLSYLTDELDGQIQPTMYSVKKRKPQTVALPLQHVSHSAVKQSGNKRNTASSPTATPSTSNYQRYRRSAQSKLQQSRP